MHLIFVLLHLAAFLFLTPALFLTVPLHLLVAVLSQRNGKVPAPTPSTHVRCPDCQELVLMQAKRCKHCGITLVPQKWNAPT